MCLFKIPDSVVSYASTDNYKFEQDEILKVVNSNIKAINEYIYDLYKVELEYSDMVHVGKSATRDEGIFIYNGNEFEMLELREGDDYGYIPKKFKLFEAPHFLTLPKVFKYIYIGGNVYVNSHMSNGNDEELQSNMGPWQYSMVWDNQQYRDDIVNAVKVVDDVPYSTVNIETDRGSKKVLVVLDVSILENDMEVEDFKSLDRLEKFKELIGTSERYSYRLFEFDYEEIVNKIVDAEKPDYVLYL